MLIPKSIAGAGSATVAALLFLAGCGGGQISTSNPVNAPTASPTPSAAPTVCPAAETVVGWLLYPEPSSSGAPDGNFDVYVAENNAVTTTMPGSLILTPANGGQAITGGAWTATASAPPSPAATAPPASGGGTYPVFTSYVPALQSKTTYNVAVQMPQSSCPTVSGNLGSLTTE